MTDMQIKALQMLFTLVARWMLTLAFMWLFTDFLKPYMLNEYLVAINGALIGWKITGIR